MHFLKLFDSLHALTRREKYDPEGHAESQRGRGSGGTTRGRGRGRGDGPGRDAGRARDARDDSYRRDNRYGNDDHGRGERSRGDDRGERSRGDDRGGRNGERSRGDDRGERVDRGGGKRPRDEDEFGRNRPSESEEPSSKNAEVNKVVRCSTHEVANVSLQLRDMLKKAEAAIHQRAENAQVQQKQEAKQRASFLYGGGAPPAQKTATASPPPQTIEQPTKQSVATPAPAPAPAVDISGLDLNQLTARAMKAKMKGKIAEYERIQQRIAGLQAGNSSESAPAASADQSEVVVLSGFDARGRPLSTMSSSRQQSTPDLRKEDMRNGSRRGKLDAKGAAKADVAGEKLNIRELVEQERTTGASDMDDVYARNILRLGGRFKGAEEKASSKSGFDEEEEIDTRMYEDAANRMTERKRQEVERSRAISDHNRMSKMNFWWWPMEDNTQFKKHLMISLGDHAYLMLHRSEDQVISMLRGRVVVILC